MYHCSHKWAVGWFTHLLLSGPHNNRNCQDVLFMWHACYVTVTCCKQISVNRQWTDQHPLFLGPAYLHNNSDFESHCHFYHLKMNYAAPLPGQFSNWQRQWTCSCKGNHNSILGVHQCALYATSVYKLNCLNCLMKIKGLPVFISVCL